jgi:LuxR family transcriptional regulator, maltose regulon positive regulatory protein
MAKNIPRQVVWNPEAFCYQINTQTQQGLISAVINDESEMWEQWLKQTVSFAFHSKNGEHFTARKERRQRGGEYWTAYRKIGGKLRRKYLGISSDLALSLLEATSIDLAPPKILSTNLYSQSSFVSPSPNTLAPLFQHWQEPLLTTKFTVPATRRTLIRRSRLETLLTDGNIHPVTLISAPAGFGKTSLLEGWIRGKRGQNNNIAWVSLDDADNSLMRFWMYVLTALNKSLKGVGKQSLSLLQEGQATAVEYVITTLINSLSLCGDSIVLVLDDYQVIHEPSIHTSLDFLIEHQPAQLRLILVSRNDPPLKLSRLRARGKLLEIHEDNLRCTEEEALQFFDKVMNMLSRVMERADGWLAGLQLLALSARRGDIASFEFLSPAMGTGRFIVDYLTEEVLKQQSAPIQEFLLYTSILDPLNPSLCDAVMKQSNAHIILNEIEKANLFVRPLDQQRKWYRYHALFAESLRYQLGQTRSEMLPILHRRASLWYADHNQISEAIEHGIQAQDWELAANLIESSAWVLLSSKGLTLWNWLKQFPPDIVQAHPRLCQLNVSLINRVGPLRDALPWLQVLEESFNNLSSSSGGDIPALFKPKSLQFGQIAAFRALVTSYYGQEAETVVLCQQAQSNLQEEDYFEQAVVATAQATLAEGAGKAVLAAHHYLRAGHLHQQTGNLADAVLNISLAATSLHLQAKLSAAWRTCERAIELVTPVNAPPSALVCFAYARQANLLREWNRLDEALDLILESINLGMQIGYPLALLAGYEVLVLVHLSRGDLDGAELALQQLSVLPCIGDNVSLRAWWFTNSQVRLWLDQGQRDTARRWAVELLHGKRAASSFVKEREDIARARVFLALQQPNEALKVLQRLILDASAHERFDHVIEMYILESRAYYLCGKEQAALASLIKAIRLGEPEGYIRSFVDEGSTIAHLLSNLRLAQPPEASPVYLDRLLATFSTNNAMGRLTIKYPLIESLSDREQEVLQYLARGLSNQEIADQLVLSIDTVKRHLSNIFLKLGVSNRTQAVVQAQTIGILTGDR